MRARVILVALGLAGMAALPALLPANEQGNVTIQVSDDQIEFRAGKTLIGMYNKGANVAKPYFWPLNGPHNGPITRGWPMTEKATGGSEDHVHQKSAWFCHGDIIPDGIELKDKIKGVAGVDFWSEAKGHGKIVCVSVDKPKTDGIHGSIVTRNEWRAADGTKIMDETRTIHLHNYGEARLLVFDIDLFASVCNLTFGDTKEGSFGIRVNDAIRESPGKGQTGEGKIENADGKVNEKNCWGQKSAWCDYSGTINGKVVGIAVFDDPKNPHPACWHSRGYGLMAANPFGRSRSFPAMKDNKDLVKLAKGEHLKLRYGILIHSGDAKAGKVAEYFDKFAKRTD